MRLRLMRAAVAWGICAAAPCALAHDDQPMLYNQIDLSASADQEIPNDLLIATLYTEHEGQRQAEVAERVNKTMVWALAQAKSVTGVTAQTTQYNTYPIYANNTTTISGWRARQAVRLEARDAKLLGDLIATMQERLVVESIGFEVSKGARDAAEATLTIQALAQFQVRAEQVASTLGHPGYRVVRLNLGTGGEIPSPSARGALMMAEKSTAPAQLEAGAQTMNVTVSGTIQLDAKP